MKNGRQAMKTIRTRLSFANVVSVLALFVALGAGAYAAETVHRDSITVNKLDFPIGGDGVTKTGKLTSNGSFQTVAQTKVRIDDRGAVMLLNGDIDVDNTAN